MIDLGDGASVRVAPPELPTVRTSPPLPPNVTVLPVAGPPGPAGTGGSGFTTAVDGLELVVTVTSDWGVDDDGPYWDPAGADPTDAAVASLDADGHLVLTKPAED